MFAGLPSGSPSAASTSGTAAVSAGRTCTVTSSISSAAVPDFTASNIACMAGDGVWWTISSLATAPILWDSSPVSGYQGSQTGTLDTILTKWIDIVGI